VLVVFARAPQLGRVKTRLAAGIGETQALDAYRTMLVDTLATCASLADTRTLLCVEREDVDGECAALAGRFGAHVARQRAGDLGQRMYEALAAQLGAGRLPVLIGCDCPPLTAGDLEAAFDALRTADAVFAPTEDGGYALVGVRRSLPEAFRGPAWGSDTVMRATREALRAQGVRWAELRTLWDVDDIAGYRRWLAWRGASRDEPGGRVDGGGGGGGVEERGGAGRT